MANTDEPTKDLKEPQAYETQPIMNAILERLNDGFADMKAQFAQVTSRLDALEKSVNALEKTVASLNRKFDVLAIESVTAKSELLGVKNRLDDLEQKAS